MAEVSVIVLVPPPEATGEEHAVGPTEHELNASVPCVTWSVMGPLPPSVSVALTVITALLGLTIGFGLTLTDNTAAADRPRGVGRRQQQDSEREGQTEGQACVSQHHQPPSV